VRIQAFPPFRQQMVNGSLTIGQGRQCFPNV
jgi:hypothetical protein